MKSLIAFSGLLVIFFVETTSGFGCCCRPPLPLPLPLPLPCAPSFCGGFKHVQEGKPITLPIPIPTHIPLGKVCTCSKVQLKPIPFDLGCGLPLPFPLGKYPGKFGLPALKKLPCDLSCEDPCAPLLDLKGLLALKSAFKPCLDPCHDPCC